MPRRVLPGVLLLLCGTAAHVPSYDCPDGCCHPPRHHNDSQVFYHRNAGGVELDKSDLDVAGGELIEFSIGFRDEVDKTTYEIYVGCGGCAPTDPLLANRTSARRQGYEMGKLEPFTQTWYRGFYPDGPQQFNASLLQTCTSDHWTIRLVPFPNATGDIVWSTVLGCPTMACEKFSFGELFLFPWYVVRNHGPVWNDLAWTLPVIFAVVAGFVIILRFCIGPFVLFEKADRDVAGNLEYYNVSGTSWKLSPRAVLYAIAVYVLVVDLLETVVHMIYAGTRNRILLEARSLWGFGVGLVIVFGKLFPLVVIAITWHLHRMYSRGYLRTLGVWGFGNVLDPDLERLEQDRYVDGKYGIGPFAWFLWYGPGRFMGPFWACESWWILEFANGFLLFTIWFGGGYWVAGLCQLVASLIRAFYWIVWASEVYRKRDKDARKYPTGRALASAMPLASSDLEVFVDAAPMPLLALATR